RRAAVGGSFDQTSRLQPGPGFRAVHNGNRACPSSLPDPIAPGEGDGAAAEHPLLNHRNRARHRVRVGPAFEPGLPKVSWGNTERLPGIHKWTLKSGIGIEWRLDKAQ